MEECCSKIIKGVELEGKSGWSLILTDGVTVYDAEGENMKYVESFVWLVVTQLLILQHSTKEFFKLVYNLTILQSIL